MAKGVDIEEIQNPTEELGGTDASLMEAADDLMPNTGDAFLPPETEEQQQEDAEEKSKVTSAAPYIDDLIEWFQQQIDLCDSVKNVLATSDKKKLDLNNAMVAHDIVRQLLENKLVEMINQREAWIDPQKR